MHVRDAQPEYGGRRAGRPDDPPLVEGDRFVAGLFSPPERARLVELEFAPLYTEFGLGTTIWSPLASGLLTGKMTLDSKFAQEDHRNFNRYGQAFDRGETFSGVDFEAGLKAVDELRQVLPAGASMTQFALRWILMFDAVTCAIPGAKRPAQIEENVAASDLPPLSGVQMKAVENVYNRYCRAQVHHRW